MDDPFTLMGARVIGLGVPMGCEGCPPPSKGRPPHVGGHSLLPRSVSPSAGGMLAIYGRSPPTWAMGDPLTRRDTPIGDDGCTHQARRRPRSRKGCIPPGEADTR